MIQSQEVRNALLLLHREIKAIFSELDQAYMASNSDHATVVLASERDKMFDHLQELHVMQKSLSKFGFKEITKEEFNRKPEEEQTT